MAQGNEGIILLVIGLVLGIFGVVAAYYCTATFGGNCVQYAYHDIGLLGAGLGGILAIIGIVVLVVKPGSYR